MLLLILLLVSPSPGEDASIDVVLQGSPPLPQLYQLDIDSVSIESIALLQERLLQWYLEEGYPFASAGFFFSDPDTLVVNVVPGRHALLEDVLIEGMPGTRPEVFTRLLSMKPGEYYSRDEVSEWLQKISRYEFIDGLGPTTLYLGRGGNLVLVQQVEKGSAGYFSAAMDWRGENLEGMGEVLFLNLAGTARELELRGQSTDWGGFNAYVRYREPWIFGYPVSLQLEASQDTPESSWVNREGNLTGIWSMDRIELTAGAGLWRGYPPDGSRQEYDYGLAGMDYSTMVRVPQGQQGFELAIGARSGSSSGGDSSGVLTMAELDSRLSFFNGLLGFGGRIMGGGVMQGDWFSGLLMQLGGQATIRGYPENSFRAVRYAVARPEISLGETETRIYLFTDLAVVKTDEDEIRFPAGSGAGIRGRSGMFHADAAVGFPLQEGLGSSRLYLRLRASI
jgi:hypothetical protein